jgi:hypothetical protein
VVLEATHVNALDIVSIDDLERHAVAPSKPSAAPGARDDVD